ncbi:MAG: FAD-dependent oxidoreductase [Planctomycetes bacterium]|nr:FAD-dependent oxidoreductase [Planctomycetota bacterium]
MGVKMVTECCVGKDISLAELRAKHDAVVIAVGAKCSRDARFPGGDASGVLGGVEFLRSVSLGQIPEMGQRIVVVGGGDSAMDSARSALRIKAEEEDADQYFAVDAARSASLFGARDVTIVYRRSRTEMPAIETEIIEAEEEGIKFHLLTSPLRIEKNEQGRVKGVWCEKMELGEADSSGRRKPVPVDGSDHFIECDNVILAIGQTFDLSFVDPVKDGLEMTDWGTLKCDPQLGTTTAPDVYVAGDLAYGPKLVIHAVASGKQIARTIYGDLTGRSITYNDTELHLAGLGYERETDYEHQTRVPIDTMDVQDRPQSQKVMTEKSYTTPQAGCEAGRCLDCGVNTIFDGEKCILCGGCVDVCPELCLRIVSADLLDADDTQTSMISQHLDDMAPERASAILKDETLCIRCGLCAERCPTGAITMERFMFREIPLCRND